MRRVLVLAVIIFSGAACSGQKREAAKVNDLERDMQAEARRCADAGGQDANLTCTLPCAQEGAYCPDAYQCDEPEGDGLTGVACSHVEISNCWACAHP